MRKIRAYLNTDLAGCTIEEEFEVDNNASEDEIEEMAKEAMFDHIDWGGTKLLILRMMNDVDPRNTTIIFRG